ncbi:phosphoribosyltransferase-like protein [Protomyces lactucae-debilis]|uniref:orotate phosphoribosyltransferase n=1 Tax=Protomyces lactucae-debilis TaxID=2754530 RepID=A0A1Y2FUR5_PROLT|nr:phosphoribosyltransferase-like protein [Protomyces lactucae-debilis]ORY87748.1 phosphoribosyltransferase-like protein [Protomyces lactucae-debilis]
MPTQTQKAFLQVATDNAILKFGTFTLKSGRQSPYFFNAGLFNTGALLSSLCRAYAETIESCSVDFDVLFGPAYKGIPLAAVTATKLADSGRQVEYAFNRKEKKAHGEGGSLVGASMKGKRVLVIDDVMTAGTAIREAIDIIKAEGGILAGVVVALDRQERGTDSTLSTVAMVEQEFNVKVHAIVRFEDIIAYSREALSSDDTERMEAYRKQYGI